MSNIVLDENKIDTLLSSYHDTEELLIESSDEHLDIILILQKSIKELTQLTIDVNNELEKKFNSMDAETAKNVVIKLTVGLRLARHFHRFLKTFPPHISESIKACRKDLYVETKQVDEFLQDLINYKVNKPTEIMELLNGIN